jgi:hypothetical protein
MSSPFPPKLVVNGAMTPVVDPQTRAFTKVLLVTSIGYVCALLAVFALINEEVPNPYMDEVFHVDQARKYCVGNFTQVCTFCRESHQSVNLTQKVCLLFDSGIQR